MSYYISQTGEFSGNETFKTGSRKFDVRFRLVSTAPISAGDAWGIAYNRLRLQHNLFQGAALESVAIEGKPDAWGQCFDVTAHYSAEDKESEQQWATISFSTRGGREKKIHSFSTLSYPAPGESAPDFNHGIGFNNGIFQGVDVVVPHFGFSLDVDLPGSVISNSQIAFFHSLTGKVNAAPWWIFRRGEVLFLGLTGNSYRKKNAQDVYELWYRLSFEFEAMPSIVNGTIPPFSGVQKEGFEYFWTFHQEKKDDTSGITIPQPIAGYVEKVYEYGDFLWFSNLNW